MNKQGDIVIVCDGAYRDEMLIGGIAGHITLVTEGAPLVSKSFSLPVIGYKDCNQVEMKAIEMSLKTASDLAIESNVEIKSVTVNTDSDNARAAIKNYEKGLTNPKYFGLAKRIRTAGESLVDNGDFTNIKFNYVKAHVSYTRATPIERLHNEVDELAVNAKDALFFSFTRPNLEEKTIGVALPARPREVDGRNFSALGKSLAEQGYSVRVVFDGAVRKDKEHPFLKGFANALPDPEKELNQRLYDATDYRPVNVIRASREPLAGIAGVLFSMEQRRRLDITAKKVNATSIIASQAGEAAGLWYGENSLTSKLDNGQFPKSSQMLLDLTEGPINADNPRNLSSWCEVIGDLRARGRPPIHVGLEQAVAALPGVEIKVEIGEDPVAALMEKIEGFVNSGFDALSKDEMSNGIQQLCAEAGLHAPLISLQHVVKAKTPEQVAKRGMEMSARLYQYQVVDKMDAKPHEETIEEPTHRRFARR
ncbi:hypothetical protein BM525_19690 (plasmid) [Alteromonas mediterranea]|uniref:RNase H type-1 domain-containing protein n=1 Tax=Alteromonas mediterranea TaxID=314275 RepID=A0AAC9JHH2_9ALTE|nr:RNase H family protein [Alteromonas mediterranea]APD92107.1 hypothetical protein BM524_19495 [Alteromonas mediterranea]APD99961.1 hypothetical protein BM525_19690 [Alteromonas mediterranea]